MTKIHLTFDEDEQELKAKLIASGTYGCIYENAICKEEEEEKDDIVPFITKIQDPHKSDIMDDEIKIGQRIQSIFSYEYRFAPIIKKCNVNWTEIASSVNECPILRKSTHPMQYVSTKVRDLGRNNTLEQYFDKIRLLLPTDVFERKIISTYNYLKESLSELHTAGIVHHDLKENNILMDAVNNVPVIIDFGLSFFIDKDKNKDTCKRNFIFEQYDFWCLDTYIASYICQFNTPINPELVIDKYFQNNSVFSSASSSASSSSSAQQLADAYFSTDEINIFRALCVERVNKYKNTTIDEWIVPNIVKHWDMYSLSVIFLFLIRPYSEFRNTTFIRDLKQEILFLSN